DRFGCHDFHLPVRAESLCPFRLQARIVRVFVGQAQRKGEKWARVARIMALRESVTTLFSDRPLARRISLQRATGKATKRVLYDAVFGTAVCQNDQSRR